MNDLKDKIPCSVTECKDKLSSSFQEMSTVKKIKSKSQNQWINYFKNAWESFYDVITDSAEKCILAGFIGGVLLSFFFVYVLFVAVLALFVFLLIWVIADEEPAEDQSEVVEEAKPVVKKTTKKSTTKKASESKSSTTKKTQSKSASKKATTSSKSAE